MLTPLKGFIGPSYVSRNPQFDFTRSVNWYPSIDENQTGTNQQINQLLCTPGLTNVLNTVLTASGQKSIRGIYTATDGKCFFVSGHTLYVLQGAESPYTPVACGTLLTSRGRVRFADNGIELVVVDGPNGYSTTLANPNGDFAQIVDPAFQGATFVEYYDGYFIFNKPGTVIFYWSDPNAVTFDALNFASKSGNADPIAGLVVLFRQMWLIGTQTTEIWYDVGGDSTFQRLAGPYVEQGCAAPDTIAKGETGIFWVAQSLRGGVTVVRTNNNSLIKVSTLSVDFQLQQYGTSIQRATGFCYQQDGDLFYQINPYNGTSSWVFDDTITSLLGYPQQWHERTHTIQPEESTSAVTNGTEERHLGDCACFFNGQTLVGSWKAPKLYAFDTTNATDDGGYIARTRIAPHISVNGNRVFYGLFRLGCQTGVGTRYVTIDGPASINLNSAAVISDLNSQNPEDTNTIIGFWDSQSQGITSNTGFFGHIFANNSVLGDLIGQLAMNTVPLTGAPDVVSVTLYANDGITVPPENHFFNMAYVDSNGVTQLYETGGNTQISYTQYNASGCTAAQANWMFRGNGAAWANSDISGSDINVYFNVLSTPTTQIVAIDPCVMLSWSNDGAYEWSEEMPTSVGATGQYGEVVEWWRLGEGRNRIFRIRFTEKFILNLSYAAVDAQPTDN
jgi:hypothetical protein